MPSAKEKAGKEILCPEAVSQEPVFQQNKYMRLETVRRHLRPVNALTVPELNAIMGREVPQSNTSEHAS